MYKEPVEMRRWAIVLAGQNKMIRIDKTVKSFVLKLNRINGVYTSSSCGGHERPGGSRQPLGEFFVIMRIWNKEFLKEFNNLCREYEDICTFEYNDLYRTWCVHGLVEVMDYILEPFVDGYITTQGNLKPESDWLSFYSYDDSPPKHPEYNNTETIAYFKEYAVLWN